MANRVTTQELVDDLDACIRDVLRAGQSYRLGDRLTTRADLPELIKARDHLKAELLAVTGKRPGVASADMTGNFS